MTEVTIDSDFGAQGNKICHHFQVFPYICCEVKWPHAMAYSFTDLRKPILPWLWSVKAVVHEGVVSNSLPEGKKESLLQPIPSQKQKLWFKNY